MKTNIKTEREMITELESAYQKVYEKESQLKEHGHREGNGTARYQTMSDVRDSEESYRRLFETAQDGILILNAESGTITDANPYIIESLGYSLKELKGKRLWEIGAFVDIKESKAAFEELQRKEYIRYKDLPLKTKDGQNRQVEFVSNVYFVHGEKIIQCNIRDITERRLAEQESKRSEESLRESEERYRRLFETAQDGILILDAESGAITDANPYITKSLGYALEDLLGKRLWEIGAFADVKDSKTAFQELQQKEFIRYNDLPLRTKNGESRAVEFVSNVYPVNGKKVIQCNIRDITERRLAEDTSRKSVEKYKNLVETIPDGFYQSTPAGRFIEVNPAMVTMLGYDSKEELLRIDIPTELYFKIDDRFTENYNREFTSDTEEYRMRKKDGSAIWIEDRCRYIQDESGKILYHEGVCRDITVRKHIEKLLRESEERLRVTLEATKISTWDWDVKNDQWQTSPMFYSMLGNIPDLNPQNSEVRLRTIHPDDRATVAEKIQVVLNGTIPDFQYEARMRHFDGTYRWHNVIGHTIERDADGKPSRMIGVRMDITDRKHAEEALTQERNLLKSLMDNTPDQIYFKDIDSRFIRMSKSVAEKFGSSDPAQLIGKKDSDFFSEEHSRPAYENEQEIINTGRPLINEEEMETWPDGRVTWASTTKLPYRNSSGQIIGTFGISRDITERKQDEQRIRESEKRFKALFDQAPIAIALLDAEGRLIISNAILSKMIGYTNTELSQMKFTDFTYSEDVDLDLNKFNNLIEGKISHYSMEKRYIHKNGSVVWGNLFVTILQDENGSQKEILKMIEDISERKAAEIRLKESTEKFHQLADNISDAFWIRSPDMSEVQYISPAFEKIWGRSTESLYAHPEQWSDFIFSEDRERVLKSFDSLNANTPSLDIEYRITRPDNEIRWVHLRGFQVRNAANTPIRHIGIVSDITDRKRANEQLKKSEEKYRGIFENVQDVFFETTIDGTIEELSPSIDIISKGQYHRDDLLGHSMFDFYNNATEWKELISVLQQQGSVSDFEVTLRNRDGSRVHCSVSAKFRYDSDGRPEKIVGTLRDISERKQAQDALRIGEERYRLLFDNSIDAILLTNPDGRIISANPAACRIFGKTEEEILKGGRDGIVDILDPRLKQGIEERDRTGKFAGEITLVRNNGTRFPGEISTAMYKDNEGHVVTSMSIRDISERNQAEKQIALLAHTLRSVTECVSVTDLNDIVLFVNDAFLKTYGYTEEEVVGKNIQIVRSLNNPPETSGGIRTATLSGGWNGELMNRASNGREFPVSLSTSFVRDEEGHAVALVGVASDITERRNVEKHLQESEERYRRLVEFSPDAIAVHCDGLFVYLNPAAVKLIGATDASQLIGTPALNVVHPESRELARRRIMTGLKEDKPLPIVEEKFLKMDGSVIDVNVVALPVVFGKKPAIQIIVRDITEQKKLQQDLLQLQKSESIGTLAGGIAHDFNNILGIILGYTYVIEKKSSDVKILSNSVAAINQAVKRGTALVRQILTFARKTETAFVPTSISEMVQELVSMLSQTFPKIITLKNNFPGDIPFILADRAQMHQALLNLCVNARDAMPNGGSIILDAEKLSGVLVKEQFPAADQQWYVCISVSDTGEGMNETTRSRIFDPFFTTKPQSKGTGLGLSVVHGIVQAHHGFIDVKSVLDKGTTFRLYFPVPDYKVELAESQDTNSFSDGGTETILLVEDEELLLDMARFLLESKGYTILVAHDGAEAIEVYKQHQNKIDLVITDLGLPIMTGVEEYKKLKEIVPDVKVIFASGFIDPDVKSELLIAGAKFFLQKPYVADEMLKIIRKALEKGRK